MALPRRVSLCVLAMCVRSFAVDSLQHSLGGKQHTFSALTVNSMVAPNKTLTSVILHLHDRLSNISSSRCSDELIEELRDVENQTLALLSAARSLDDHQRDTLKDLLHKLSTAHHTSRLCFTALNKNEKMMEDPMQSDAADDDFSGGGDLHLDSTDGDDESEYDDDDDDEEDDEEEGSSDYAHSEHIHTSHLNSPGKPRMHTDADLSQLPTHRPESYASRKPPPHNHAVGAVYYRPIELVCFIAILALSRSVLTYALDVFQSQLV